MKDRSFYKKSVDECAETRYEINEIHYKTRLKI